MYMMKHENNGFINTNDINLITRMCLPIRATGTDRRW